MSKHIPARRVPRDRFPVAPVPPPTNEIAWSPMTTNGDVLYYNSGQQRLAKGSDTQVLTLASGIPSWAASSGGISVTVSTSAPSGSANDGDLWCRI